MELSGGACPTFVEKIKLKDEGGFGLLTEILSYNWPSLPAQDYKTLTPKYEHFRHNPAMLTEKLGQ